MTIIEILRKAEEMEVPATVALLARARYLKQELKHFGEVLRRRAGENHPTHWKRGPEVRHPANEGTAPTHVEKDGYQDPQRTPPPVRFSFARHRKTSMPKIVDSYTKIVVMPP